MSGTEEPVYVRLQRMEEQLHIYDGLARALAEPRRVLDIVPQAEDADRAAAALQEQLGLDPLQARAVMDLQFRRATVVDRRKIEDLRREVMDQIASLRLSGPRTSGS